jgi:tripartite-type tricarboxylate transporter receptor subunit TctC
MLGSLVSEDLGQPVVIINKPGAASTIAAAEAAGSKPDGYTLMSFPIITVTVTPFFVKVKYDPVTSFEPLMSPWGFPYAICVQQNAPWKSFRELIEWARKNPGELSVSTPGTGTPQHVAFEWIAKAEKIEYKHVPYPGGLPAATALLGDMWYWSAPIFLSDRAVQDVGFYFPGNQNILISYHQGAGLIVPAARAQVVAVPRGSRTYFENVRECP